MITTGCRDTDIGGWRAVVALLCYHSVVVLPGYAVLCAFCITYGMGFWALWRVACGLWLVASGLRVEQQKTKGIVSHESTPQVGCTMECVLINC